MTEGTGLRRAADATDGDARPVGSCETDDSVCPHHGQAAAPSSTSEEQLGQRITRGILCPHQNIAAAAQRRLDLTLHPLPPDGWRDPVHRPSPPHGWGEGERSSPTACVDLPSADVVQVLPSSDVSHLKVCEVGDVTTTV